jgi:hypothetical protein
MIFTKIISKTFLKNDFFTHKNENTHILVFQNVFFIPFLSEG